MYVYIYMISDLHTNSNCNTYIHQTHQHICTSLTNSYTPHVHQGSDGRCKRLVDNPINVLVFVVLEVGTGL